MPHLHHLHDHCYPRTFPSFHNSDFLPNRHLCRRLSLHHICFHLCLLHRQLVALFLLRDPLTSTSSPPLLCLPHLRRDAHLSPPSSPLIYQAPPSTPPPHRDTTPLHKYNSAKTTSMWLPLAPPRLYVPSPSTISRTMSICPHHRQTCHLYRCLAPLLGKETTRIEKDITNLAKRIRSLKERLIISQYEEGI